MSYKLKDNKKDLFRPDPLKECSKRNGKVLRAGSERVSTAIKKGLYFR